MLPRSHRDDPLQGSEYERGNSDKMEIRIREEREWVRGERHRVILEG